jgi:hypothetical protein
MVSIKYVVPGGAPIELWDGGISVTLEPGQTIQSMASMYGVPAWAIQQASNISDDEAVSPGQRLIVPRHSNTLAPTGMHAPDFSQQSSGRNDRLSYSRQ